VPSAPPTAWMRSLPRVVAVLLVGRTLVISRPRQHLGPTLMRRRLGGRHAIAAIIPRMSRDGGLPERVQALSALTPPRRVGGTNGVPRAIGWLDSETHIRERSQA